MTIMKHFQVDCAFVKTSNTDFYDLNASGRHSIRDQLGNVEHLRLARSAKLFVSEQGTHWGDLILSFREKHNLSVGTIHWPTFTAARNQLHQASSPPGKP